MTPTRHLVAAPSFGPTYGEPFDDTPPTDVLPNTTITKIVIAYSGSFITGIEVPPGSPGISAYANASYRPDTLCNGGPSCRPPWRAISLDKDARAESVRIRNDDPRKHLRGENRAYDIRHEQTYLTWVAESRSTCYVANMDAGVLDTVGMMPKDGKIVVWSVADKVPSQLAHRMGLVGFAGYV